MDDSDREYVDTEIATLEKKFNACQTMVEAMLSGLLRKDVSFHDENLLADDDYMKYLLSSLGKRKSRPYPESIFEFDV